MGEPLRVAVLGGGNGAQTTAADLTFKGHCVNLYQLRSFKEEFSPVLKRGGIEVVGKKKKDATAIGIREIGFAKLNKATIEIEEAMEGVELVIIVVPAFAQRPFIDICAPFLRDGHVLLLSPGRTGGALMAAKALKENGVGADVVIAENSTLFYATRIVGPAQVMVYADKMCLYTGVLPASRTAEAMRVLNRVYPEFVGVSSTLETSLYNIGGVFHPAPALLNAGWIESTRGDFKFYAQGMTPSVVKVMEAIDKERMDLCEAFGLKRKGIVEILNEYYGNLYPGWSLYEVAHKSEVYASIMGPPDMTARFISEEIPHTLVPMALLGKMSDVPTPVMDMIIDISNIMTGCDYRKDGRTLEKLGLNNMSVVEIKQRVEL